MMAVAARRFSILLFIIFYLASGMAASRYRAVRTARRVFYAALQGQDIQIGDWSGPSDDHRPRYREAKKAGVEFPFRSAHAIDLAPRATSFEFNVFLLCWETHHNFSSPATRAPPVRA